MSAVAAVRYLLAHDASLTAQVPAARIFSGMIPLAETLPAIAVNEISVVENLNVALPAGGKLLAQARVQVTVQAKSYPAQKQVLELVRKALPNTTGTVNGVALDSIVPDGAGPDFRDDQAGLFMQSRDFLVRFVET